MGYGGREAQGLVVDGGVDRWPANIVHDGSEEVEDAFGIYADGAAPFFYSAKANPEDRMGKCASHY